MQRMIDEKRQRAAAARKPFLVVHPGQYCGGVLVWVPMLLPRCYHCAAAAVVLLLLLVPSRCCCCCCEWQRVETEPR